MRTQTESPEKREQISRETGTDCSSEGLPDLARQEMKQDADINFLLKRFGVEDLNKRPMTFRDVNYDVDLQQALSAIHDVRVAYATMPKIVKDKYTSWQKFVTALETGELEILDKSKEPAIIPPPVTPPAP